MVTCNCIVQDGQISAETEASLKTQIGEFTKRAFGQTATINWAVIPENSGFTAGAPSTSSIISMGAPEPVDQPRRAELLHELCSLWSRETGCPLNEIVGVIADPSSN